MLLLIGNLLCKMINCFSKTNPCFHTLLFLQLFTVVHSPFENIFHILVLRIVRIRFVADWMIIMIEWSIGWRLCLCCLSLAVEKKNDAGNDICKKKLVFWRHNILHYKTWICKIKAVSHTIENEKRILSFLNGKSIILLRSRWNDNEPTKIMTHGMHKVHNTNATKLFSF